MKYSVIRKGSDVSTVTIEKSRKNVNLCEHKAFACLKYLKLLEKYLCYHSHRLTKQSTHKEGRVSSQFDASNAILVLKCSFPKSKQDEKTTLVQDTRGPCTLLA